MGERRQLPPGFCAGRVLAVVCVDVHHGIGIRVVTPGKWAQLAIAIGGSGLFALVGSEFSRRLERHGKKPPGSADCVPAGSSELTSPGVRPPVPVDVTGEIAALSPTTGPDRGRPELRPAVSQLRHSARSRVLHVGVVAEGPGDPTKSLITDLSAANVDAVPAPPPGPTHAGVWIVIDDVGANDLANVLSSWLQRQRGSARVILTSWGRDAKVVARKDVEGAPVDAMSKAITDLVEV